MLWILLLVVQTEPIHVSLPVSTPGKSHQAAVIFEDEAAISKIVLGIDRESVSVDVVDNRIFLKLLKPAEGHLDCVVSSGLLYRILVAHSEKDPTQIVRVRPKKASPRSRSPRPIELVRLMRESRSREDVSCSRLEGIIYESSHLRIHARLAYRWETLRGYVCEIRNVSQVERAVDLSRFRAKGLLLVACRELSIPPGGSTLLYLVFES